MFKKSILFVSFLFVLSSLMLVGCGGGGSGSSGNNNQSEEIP